MPQQWPGEEEFDDLDPSEFDDDIPESDLPALKPVKEGTKYFTVEEIRKMTVDDLRPHFKDVRGVWRTANLFEETCDDPAKYPPVYTLKDSDTSSCVSLKRLYLAMEDVTEHVFAKHTLGSWDHWESITQSFILKPHIEEWRAELERQLRSKYLRMIKEQAEGGEGPNALNATKYLLEQTTVFGKEKSTRGRPSKKEKEAHLMRETKDSAALAADAKRLGISVVK
jgi:hypothetical protein